MAKLFCLLNNKNAAIHKDVVESLNYNPGWRKKVFQSEDIFLGCFEIPFKNEADYWHEEGDYVIVVDGEIMSWRDKAKGGAPAQRLLNLYKAKGEALVDYVNGSFSIVIWDKVNKALCVLNDRHGFRPLYYAQYKGKTFVASEIKAIIADRDFNKKYDKDSIIDFFTYDYVMNDRTLFDGIKVFPYANTLKINPSNGALTMSRYWDFNFSQLIPKERTIDAYAWRLKDTLSESVNRTMQGPYKVGLPLSGGLDSRAIGSMIDKKYFPLNTYTFGIKGCIDAAIAQRLSRLMGSQHRFKEIQYDRLSAFMVKGVFLNDGMVSCNHLHILNIMDVMSQHDQVALSGFAGDMLHRRMYSACQGKGVECIYSIYDTCDEEYRKKIFNAGFQKAVSKGRDRFVTLWDQICDKAKENPLDYLNITQRQRCFINFGNLVMRNFVEVRTPFTDYDFIDFCLKMPMIFKEKEFLYREMIDSFYLKFARIPQEATGLPLKPSRWEKLFVKVVDKIMGKPIAYRRPAYEYNRWYRNGVLKDFTKQVLFSPEFKNRGIFNQSEVEKIFSDHMEGKKNYAPQLGALISFELWNRIFFDGETVRPEALSYE